jgi:hypothetical protein
VAVSLPKHHKELSVSLAQSPPTQLQMHCILSPAPAGSATLREHIVTCLPRPLFYLQAFLLIVSSLQGTFLLLQEQALFPLPLSS